MMRHHLKWFLRRIRKGKTRNFLSHCDFQRGCAFQHQRGHQTGPQRRNFRVETSVSVPNSCLRTLSAVQSPQELRGLEVRREVPRHRNQTGFRRQTFHGVVRFGEWRRRLDRHPAQVWRQPRLLPELARLQVWVWQLEGGILAGAGENLPDHRWVVETCENLMGVFAQNQPGKNSYLEQRWVGGIGCSWSNFVILHV